MATSSGGYGSPLLGGYVAQVLRESPDVPLGVGCREASFAVGLVFGVTGDLRAGLACARAECVDVVDLEVELDRGRPRRLGLR
jgi:hypothetical protein